MTKDNAYDYYPKGTLTFYEAIPIREFSAFIEEAWGLDPQNRCCSENDRLHACSALLEIVVFIKNKALRGVADAHGLLSQLEVWRRRCDMQYRDEYQAPGVAERESRFTWGVTHNRSFADFILVDEFLRFVDAVGRVDPQDQPFWANNRLQACATVLETLVLIKKRAAQGSDTAQGLLEELDGWKCLCDVEYEAAWPIRKLERFSRDWRFRKPNDSEFGFWLRMVAKAGQMTPHYSGAN